MISGKLRSLTTKAIATAVVPLGMAALIGTGAQAQMKLPQIDRGHTSVHFTVWHGGVTPTIYQVRTIEKVDLQFDPKDVSKSKLTLVLEAASVGSNHHFRDTWARSATELNVWKFPKITFVSTKVEKTGENKGKITGDLTLHGVTKPITATIVRRVTKHFTGKWMVHGFVATGSFKRTDFGLKAFIPWIGDKIDFTVILEQRRPLDEMMKK
jgi:polyisoprenoid-binding protein YceI